MMDLRSQCRRERSEIETLKSSAKLSNIVVEAEIKKLKTQSHYEIEHLR